MDTKTVEAVLTVGRLRQLLALHHESDRVVLKDHDGLLSSVIVGVERGDIGHVVVLAPSEAIAISHAC